MPYEIEKVDGVHEVRVWGETSKYEVLSAIRELDRRDRGKNVPEVWLVAEGCQVPFAHYRDIAEAVKNLMPPGASPKKSAIVASGEFHKAQLELYRMEAASLPFEVRVFTGKDQALTWLRE